jgi:hypothetical protein
LCDRHFWLYSHSGFLGGCIYDGVLSSLSTSADECLFFKDRAKTRVAEQDYDRLSARLADGALLGRRRGSRQPMDGVWARCPSRMAVYMGITQLGYLTQYRLHLGATRLERPSGHLSNHSAERGQL